MKEIEMTAQQRYVILMEILENLSLFFYELKKIEFPTDFTLIPDRRLLSIILNIKENPDNSFDFFKEYVNQNLDLLMFRDKEKDRLKSFFEENSEGCIFLFGEEGAGKKHIIAHLCQEIDKQFFTIRLETQADDDIKLSKKNLERLFFTIREVRMFGTVPVIIGLEKFKASIRQEIIDTMEQCRNIFFCLSNEDTAPISIQKIMAVELPDLIDFQNRSFASS